MLNLLTVEGEERVMLRVSVGRACQVPCRRRVSRSVVDSLGQVSVTYKEYGIGLAFTPVVLSEGRISLKIETEGR